MFLGLEFIVALLVFVFVIGLLFGHDLRGRRNERANLHVLGEEGKDKKE